MLTPEDIEARRTGVGASEAPILAACDAYGRTPLWLYLQKKGMAAEEQDSIAMRIGNYLERGILDLYCQELKIDRSKVRSGIGRVDGEQKMFCTPDALLDTSDSDAINVQIKCVGTHMLRHWGKGATAESVPDYVLAQVQHEMEVLDVSSTHVVALLGGTDFKVYTVEREKSIGEELKRRVGIFWKEHMELDRPPAMDGTDAGRRLLELLFPRHPDDAEMPLSLSELPEAQATVILEAARRAAKAKRAMDEGKIVYETNRQIIQLAMEKHTSVKGRDADFQFSAKVGFARGRIDWQAYAMSLGGNETDAEIHRPEASQQFRMTLAHKTKLDKMDAVEDFLAALEREAQAL